MYVDRVCDGDQERLELELQGIKLAESGQLEEALTAFNGLLQKFPHHPSPLNNRAQVLRLLRRDTEALQDLSKATNLSPSISDAYPVTMRQVFMQRAWLLMASHENKEAEADFLEAARLGAKDAQKMAARCNPYAAMCNAMMAQVMQTYFS